MQEIIKAWIPYSFSGLLNVPELLKTYSLAVNPALLRNFFVNAGIVFLGIVVFIQVKFIRSNSFHFVIVYPSYNAFFRVSDKTYCRIPDDLEPEHSITSG